MIEIQKIAKEMRERLVNNGKHKSDTLNEWADRIEEQIAGAEICGTCESITVRLNADGCAKWCCHCGAKLNGNYLEKV